MDLAALQEDARKHGALLELPPIESTPEAVTALAERAMKEVDAALDRYAAQPVAALDFRSAVTALDDVSFQAACAANRVHLLRETHPDEKLRHAADEMSRALEEWDVKRGFREDVYRVLKAYAATDPKLSGEDQKLYRDTLREFRRRGMDLPPAERAEVEKLKTELARVSLDVETNIRDASAVERFTRAELEGVPDDFLQNPEIREADDVFKVDANVTWQYQVVAQSARREETRLRLTRARHMLVMKENTPLFQELVRLRVKIARLLGYRSWADYQLEPLMARDRKTALDFLQKLNVELEPKFRNELEELRALKVRETGDAIARIHLWDARYYENVLKKEKFEVDEDVLKSFFPLEATLDGMFRIFEDVFALEIGPVPLPAAWAADLQAIAVRDRESGRPLGIIYLDLFPRAGKYNHFAQFGITPGKRLADGRYQRPVVALVCNFPPPTPDRPSLLEHHHVETLFHEFGHALHSVLTEASYVEFSCTSVPRDFVEAPSQMLENWVWDKEVLDQFAAHFEDPSRKIPHEILARMKEAKLATMGAFYRRQLSFGLMDLAIHGEIEDALVENLIEVTNRILSEVYLEVPEGTAFLASFGHLAGGYDARYYGYAWADAIAADMASVFARSPKRFLDPELGLRLRKEVYARGDSREISESIEAFLGRPHSLEPFLREIGLAPRSAGGS